jgi:hypothetical protein
MKEGGETTSTFWKNELGNSLAMVEKPLGKWQPVSFPVGPSLGAFSMKWCQILTSTPYF